MYQRTLVVSRVVIAEADTPSGLLLLPLAFSTRLTTSFGLRVPYIATAAYLALIFIHALLTTIRVVDSHIYSALIY